MIGQVPELSTGDGDDRSQPSRWRAVQNIRAVDKKNAEPGRGLRIYRLNRGRSDIEIFDLLALLNPLDCQAHVLRLKLSRVRVDVLRG